MFGAICVAVALAVAVGVGVGVTHGKTTEVSKLTTSVATTSVATTSVATTSVATTSVATTSVATTSVATTSVATTSVAAVEAAIKLPYTKSDFTGEKQDSFRKAMAKAAGTSELDVKIKSITEVPSRRSGSDSSWMDRRAGGGFIRVDFSIAVASADAATKTLSAMSSDNINKALVREGFPEGVIVSKPQIKLLDSQSEAQVASPAPKAPPSPPSLPSRRAAFVPFESCEAIALSFGGASFAADSQLKEQLTVDEPFYDFPEDYCDSCNCSLQKTGLSLCLCVSVSLCLSVSLSLCLCLSFSLFLSLSLSLSLSLLCIYVWMCVNITDKCDCCNWYLTRSTAEPEQVYKMYDSVAMPTMSATAPASDAAPASSTKSSAAADTSAGASPAESAQDFTGTNNQVKDVC
jgi:hypothetical protein